MKALLTKRDELRATIKSAQSDLRAIEAAIRIMGGEAPRTQLFARGQLKALVCDAMRAGAEGNRAIALSVIETMRWEATDERVRDVALRVKDVTKRFR
ncbi:hypothetical protein [Maricaulis sp.]|uniref:hypothetical protein n=1 Tax=Maricaulis sp. TaxID=1486257 RepID=UPI003A957DC2